MAPAAEQVVIGMDPYKRSATIEVMTGDETIVVGGRFGTAVTATTRCGATPAIGPTGSGRSRAVPESASTAVRLLADGEEVVDVPSKL